MIELYGTLIIIFILALTLLPFWVDSKAAEFEQEKAEGQEDHERT